MAINAQGLQTGLYKRRATNRLSRLERAVHTRDTIIGAAALVVGKYGYADASVQKITEEAGVAQGTFYLYFRSRQELFDELLPTIGIGLLSFMHKAVEGSKTLYEVEERGYRAFFDYMRKNPWFFKVLTEASVQAPKANEKYLALMFDRYAASLRRSMQRGEITRFGNNEIEILAQLLVGARTQLYGRYARSPKFSRNRQEEAIAIYMKIVKGGLS